MSDERLTRALQRLDADGLISADPGIVRMMTGHSYDIETGPNVFALPAIVVASGSLEPVLVCSADEAPESANTITYEGFTIGPIERAPGARRSVAEAIDRSGGNGIRWVVDGSSIPVGALTELPYAIASVGVLAEMTAIKTTDEINDIQAAVALCDAGQAAAREAALEGASELELWQHVRRAMESQAGTRIPVLADFVSGPRSAEVGGPPSTRRIGRGDLILVDLVPRLAGVWGDSCSTFVDATPTTGQRRAHAAAQSALAAGLEMLRPGVRSADVDSLVRAVMADDGWDYPHHTGHGLGFAWHEEPRIVAGSEIVLQAGMVVALEPGTYAEDWGLRVEQVAVVTDSGPRVLSGHSLALERVSDG